MGLLNAASPGVAALVLVSAVACSTKDTAVEPAGGGSGGSKASVGGSIAGGGGSGSSSSSGGGSVDSGASPHDIGPSGTDGAAQEAGPPAPDPCIEAGSCPPGVWTDVSPTNSGLTNLSLSCGNYGVLSVQVNATHPETLYAQFNCGGIWRSTDYGLTWTGPINTGVNGATVGDCAGGITVPSRAATTPIYLSCIRGSGDGLLGLVERRRRLDLILGGSWGESAGLLPTHRRPVRPHAPAHGGA